MMQLKAKMMVQDLEETVDGSAPNPFLYSTAPLWTWPRPTLLDQTVYYKAATPLSVQDS